jgi:acyl-CoA thioesterase
VRDLGLDTVVFGENGRYSTTLAEGWDIWGPQGGYVAGAAIRAAAAASSFPRPVSLACHYLRPAEAGSAELRVESLRRTRRAESLQVTLSQNDVPVLVALIWTVAVLQGLDHDALRRPEVPPADELEPWEAFLPDRGPRFPFWNNLEIRPVEPVPFGWGHGKEPRFLFWLRFRVPPRLEDPFVDAARMLVAADCAMYPAAMIGQDEPFPYVAPSMDLALSFHATAGDSEWLLVDGCSPLSSSGLVAGRASIWSADGRLLASAMQQMLQRT